MIVGLATTWQPRGELERFQKFLPELRRVYDSIAIALPPQADVETATTLSTLPGVEAVVTPEWSWGRHWAIQKALEAPVHYIHYIDFDRLLHWVETRPDEWRQTVTFLRGRDCVVMGRTEEAYATHPDALRLTEMLTNLFFSDVLGKPFDLSAGSKSFNRSAAEFLMSRSEPGRALGTDSEWPVLLRRAGFDISYIEVEGLDWESADQGQAAAADEAMQWARAEAYDSDPANWKYRLQVALEITQAGLDALRRDLDELVDEDKMIDTAAGQFLDAAGED